jgi:ferredoxin
MKKIFHFRQKCIGCHACVSANPGRWRMSRKDGKAVLLGGKEKKGIYIIQIPDDEYEINIAAMKNCPVKIIQMED